MKKIVLAGGTGFIGQALQSYFEYKGVEVITLSRKRASHTTYWNGKDLGNWTRVLEGADALINLSGKSVDCRYNEKNRKAILSSRLDSTQVLLEAVSQLQHKPKVFLNSSTATIYAHAETRQNTEENGILGDDFSTGVAQAWEKVFFATPIEGVRKVALRSSIVLGHEGGAFPKMKWITKLGMGGKQGRGQQMISWIHIQDFCRAVDFLIKSSLSGVVNVTAPNPIQNELFMEKLSRQIGTWVCLSQPRWLLEIGAVLMKTETELLLKSRYVYPQFLLESGFTYKFETVDSCFEDLV